MSQTTVPSLKKSNEMIVKFIQRDKPFYISRLGWEGVISLYSVLYPNQPFPQSVNSIQLNAGIYCRNENDSKFFMNLYNKSVQNSSALSCFSSFNPDLIKSQNYYINSESLPVINFYATEPFNLIKENIRPWTHALHGKTVLIINPFTDSFQKQIINGFQIFKNKPIFKDGQEFKFYKSYNTSCGNRIHGSWIETFNIMCKDIEKIDFDIALLGCGGYGVPLCNFIKNKMKKSAIYIGGGIQLMFGVMGNRWENDWKKIIETEGCKFIRPSGDEVLKNYNVVENGCYW
jgi:hypothetical protein